MEPPFIDVHAIDWERWDAPGPYVLREDARRFENWETNYAGKLGLGSAIDYALALDIEQTYAAVRGLAAALRQRLAELQDVRIHDRGIELCGIVSLTLEGRHPREVARALASRSINVTAALALGTPLDLPSRGLTDGVVRASVHYYNTIDEVERFCSALATIRSAQ